ncbi:MAG: transglycosylase SLT domain-containing protein [Gammaproteobacteria bacterium]
MKRNKLNRFALSPPPGSALTLLVFFLVGIPPANADIYKYIDKYGRVHLTDKPEHTGYRLLVKTFRSEARSKYRRSAGIGSNKKNRARFSPLIAKAAHRYQLPDALLHAVITAESAYNPLAISHKGAVGLMQLMPDTARRYGVRNLTDPMANVQGGSRYLRDLLRLFKQNLRLALAAYNAGENAVIRHGYKIPPYQETQLYVEKVLQYYRQYRTVL